ncbi:camp-binding protein [Leptolyngbya sp. Heron Island J]|uniref:Crp/Fnr family transcriptional regulator n=1 Tax=Leptolyngbya sp. Heron Island J TaxID=1385935 RepID=UPI0003B96A92|nr:Crp/Fnr family transcriptional regulator [Leptolyngbya sp. Heron Island J]ESA38180.1 camp-binding protein [Leptolyngbya sp. Heron Island J]
MIQLSQELRELLGKTQLLQNLSDERLDRIAKIAIMQTFQSGGLLFSEGERCQGSFLLLSGRIKVFKISETGREQIMGLLGAGDCLAGVPAFDGQYYTTFAVALEVVKLLYFPREAFLRLLQQDAMLAFNLLTIFSHHLRRFSQLIEDLSLKDVSGRLAAYILLLSYQTANSRGVELAITKGQLAAFMGTIPETLSRALQKMGHDGLLAVDGPRIRILDFQRLQALAGDYTPNHRCLYI